MPKKRALERIRAEFLEMPDLQVTVEQTARLCGLERTVCQTALNDLVEANFLRRRSDGLYARLTERNESRWRSSANRTRE